MLRQLSKRVMMAAPVALVAALGAPALASADPAVPQIEISAASNAGCDVTFTMVNRTNSTWYQVDFTVDGEGLRYDPNVEKERGHWSVHSEIAEGVVKWAPGKALLTNLDPVTSVKTEHLPDLGYGEKMTTEHYTVQYRVAAGSESDHFLPDWQTIEVPGCVPVPEPEPEPEPDFGSLSSLSWGSSALFALLGGN